MRWLKLSWKNRKLIFLNIKIKIIETIKWILRPWPVLTSVLIVILVPKFIILFENNLENVKNYVGLGFQIIGSLLVVISINKDIGTFKNENIILIIKNWFMAFPLKKKRKKIIQGSLNITLDGATLNARGKTGYASVEEHLEELEKRIERNYQLIVEKEKIIMDHINQIQENVENSTKKEIQDMRALLSDSIVGSYKEQLFGVFLAIYGAIISI